MDICKPQTVAGILNWKLEKDYTDVPSIEKLKENLPYTNRCGGPNQTDVLYSFLGIYTLGVWVYNRDKEQSYSAFTSEKIKRRQKLYSTSFLAKLQYGIENIDINVDELNNNEQMQKFVKNYFSVGNLIPIWPGGNICRGNSNFFDIPELFFSKYSEWYKILLDLKKDCAFLDGFNDYMLSSKEEFIFKNRFSSLKNFLDSIAEEKNYNDFLDHVNTVIESRTECIKQKIDIL